MKIRTGTIRLLHPRPLLAMLFLLLLVVPAASAQGNVQQKQQNTGESHHVVWIISEDIACFNTTFCTSSPGPGLVSVHVSATAYSDHSATDIVVLTSFNIAGEIVHRTIDRDISTWSVGPGTSFLGSKTNDFILVRGTNTSMVLAHGRQYTTLQDIRNFDTGIPAKSGSWGCQQVIGRQCVEDVSALVSVTRASQEDDPAVATTTTSSSSAQSGGSNQDNNAAASTAKDTHGEVSWLLSGNTECLNPTLCPSITGNSELSTLHILFTLYADHIASAISISTLFNSAGSIVKRTIEVDRLTWSVGPGLTPPPPNVFIFGSGTNTTTVYMNGHQKTTVQPLAPANVLLNGTPAQQVTVPCQQALGTSCPVDVSNLISITKVS